MTLPTRARALAADGAYRMTTPTTEAVLEPPAIHVRFADGPHGVAIRKWSAEPFEGGVAYRRAREVLRAHDAMPIDEAAAREVELARIIAEELGDDYEAALAQADR